MVSKIFSKQRSQSHKMNAIPEGMRIYAIGDIHGCLTILDDLLVKIDRDIEKNLAKASLLSAQPKSRLVFLGDYIDRGSASANVIDRLVQLQNSERDTVFLMGNHERSLLDFLENPEDNISWLDWGGDETLRSYGVHGLNSKEARQLAKELLEAMPKHHVKFLKNLDIRHECGGYVFVHAGLRPGVPLEEQTIDDQLWIRRAFHDSVKNERLQQTVIHGHTPVKKIVDKTWRVCVDTGAVWSGVLTAVVLEGKERRFIATEANSNKLK